MQPVARERLAVMGAVALRDLVLVMREDEIEPAAMDVEASRRDAPRSSPSIRYASPAGRGPTGCPSRAGRAGDGFHSTKSAGIALVGRDLDARAGDHLVARAAARACRSRCRCATANSTWPSASIGMVRRDQRSIIAIIGAICSVARGSTSGGRQPSAATSSWNALAVRSVRSRMRFAVAPWRRR